MPKDTAGETSCGVELCRGVGSKSCLAKKFSCTLLDINKKLCFAESNEVKAQAYADRSAVYLEMKKYQECLENIRLARNFQLNDNKLSELGEREEKCKNLMKYDQSNQENDPWNFFKLSYPASKKIPFIADCLELKKDAKYGRYIVTNQDLHPGDIIAIEEPFFKHLDSNHGLKRCRNCLTANMLSLIPCPGLCVDTMFCSEKCLKEVEISHQKFECGQKNLPEDVLKFQLLFTLLFQIAGGFKGLQDLVIKSEKTTIFDFDMSNLDDPQTKQNQLKAFFGLASKSKKQKVKEFDKKLDKFVRQDLKCFWNSEKEFIVIKQIVEIYQVNAFSFSPTLFTEDLDVEKSNEEIGSTISLFGSLINHSCDPNVSLMSVDNKKVVVVQWPIKAGQQIFFCYRLPFFLQPSRDERRDELSKSYQFKCKCWACVKNFVVSLELAEKIDSEFKILTSKIDNPMDSFKRNCKKIEESFKNHPCSETIACFQLNNDLLRTLSSFGSASGM